jgi:hypothetical protein
MEDNFRIYLERRGVSEEEYRGYSGEVKQKIIAVYEKTNLPVGTTTGKSHNLTLCYESMEYLSANVHEYLL